MSKEFISQAPVGLQPQGLERQRSSADRAQEQFDTVVFMARQNNTGATLAVDEKGRAQYNIVPEKTNGANLSRGEHIILEVPTVSPLSTTGIIEQKKPNKNNAQEVNEALEAKNRRHRQNQAMFSGMDGKTVYKNGQPVNVPSGPNPENGTKNKTKRHGRRNGSR